MAKLLAVLAAFSVSAFLVNADIYLQNPRGSNNRLNERGRARNNANRLFDSQNNNRGGYNVGNLWYYAGSKLPIQWTNQHSCNDPNNNCEIIIQYMCSSKLRDGTQTRTIPNKEGACKSKDCDKDLRFGMHEDYNYYQTCTNRRRNKQLFTADQKLKGESATYTRQNSQGTRRGYECPEERDYYPYWYPTPWKDIAVLTNDVSRCEYYKKESQNVQSKWACDVPETYLYRIRRNKKRRIKGRYIPISKEECEKITGATWKENPAHNIAAPDCIQAPWSRDNHNGNGRNGYMNIYNWTVPNIDEDSCTLRIRYNISTNDFDTWKTFADKNGENGQTTKVNVADLVGLTPQQAAQRGYVFKNNPVVKLLSGSDKLQLRLAINTAQFGRTFQDRTFSFAVLPRTPELAKENIYNVNVRGKRGNIVQTYPAVEYDYVPNTLVVNKGDYVHFQWTGSNTNPGNNAGQGRAGTDRSNVVLLRPQLYAEGNPKGRDIHGHYGRNFPMNISLDTVLDLDEVDAKKLAFIQPGAGDELNDASVYFDLGAREVTRSGTNFYMCTRNNNFSNRSQKGKIVVKGGGSQDEKETEDSDMKTINSISSSENMKKDNAVENGDLAEWANEMSSSSKQENDAKPKKEVAGKKISSDGISVQKMSIVKGEDFLAKSGGKMDVGDGYASDYVAVYMDKDAADEDGQTTIDLGLKKDVDDAYVTVYHSKDMKSWDAAEQQDIVDRVAKVKVSTGGLYIARFSKSENQRRAEQNKKDSEEQSQKAKVSNLEEALENANVEDEKIERASDGENVWSIDQ